MLFGYWRHLEEQVQSKQWTDVGDYYLDSPIEPSFTLRMGPVFLEFGKEKYLNILYFHNI